MANGTTTAVANTNKRPAVSNSKQRRATSEEMAARAYEIFAKRVSSDASDLQDWLQAEEELSQSN